MNNNAATVFMNGQILMGTMEVLDLVRAETLASIRSIAADTAITTCETGFPTPRAAVARTGLIPTNSKPNPSVIHSIVIIFRLSSDICPNPETTDRTIMM
jgi:hypothetical protein